MTVPSDTTIHNIGISIVVGVCSVAAIACLSFGCGGCQAETNKANAEVIKKMVEDGRSSDDIRAVMYR